MDYHKLLQRLAELDQPTTESTIEECGDMAPLPSAAQSTTPPSMSVNLNAQGMDNIESLLKLMTKVNPDMTSGQAHAHPASLLAPPHIASIDSDDAMPAIPPMIKTSDDMMNKELAGEKEAVIDTPDDEYANEPDEEVKDVDYIINKVAGGMNRPQGTYPKVAGGDNPMQKIKSMEGTELRAAIREELQQRLEEAKTSYSAKSARAGKDIG